MFAKLTRKAAAVLGVPLALAALPLSVDFGASSPSQILKANSACATTVPPAEVVGCEPAAGYLCKLGGVVWLDKKPIIINATPAPTPQATAD